MSDKECSRSRSPLFLKETHFCSGVSRVAYVDWGDRKESSTTDLSTFLNGGIDKAPLCLAQNGLGTLAAARPVPAQDGKAVTHHELPVDDL
jgi:hypothetical protein